MANMVNKESHIETFFIDKLKELKYTYREDIKDMKSKM